MSSSAARRETAMPPADPLYPPAPPGIPADLARAGLRYRLQAVAVLLALFLFLLVYLSLLAGPVSLLLWAVFPPAEVAARFSDSHSSLVFFILLRIGLFAAAAMFSLFLFKGFFNRQVDDTLDYVEITE